MPEAWIAPPATRELRELVRHRAKLVGIRSNCQVQIHAVLAKCGIQVSMTDLFGLAGTELLDRLKLPKPYAARIASLRRIITALDFEIDAFAGQVRARLVRDPGFLAVQAIPRGGVPAGPLGRDRIGADPAQDQCGGPDPGPGRGPPRQPAHRCRRGRAASTRVRLLRPAGPPGPRVAGCSTGGGMTRRHPNSWLVRVVQVMTPIRGVVAPSD